MGPLHQAILDWSRLPATRVYETIHANFVKQGKQPHGFVNQLRYKVALKKMKVKICEKKKTSKMYYDIKCLFYNIKEYTPYDER